MNQTVPNAAAILREAIARHIRYTLVRRESLKPEELLTPVALATRDQLVDRMLQTDLHYRSVDAKRIYYLSMEFLMGRLLGDTLCNLRLDELMGEVLRDIGVDLSDVLAKEPDAGLGNGGLGRLAACFLESMATLGMPGMGYGIDYDYGLFRQEIFNGYQREKPDRWKVNGSPFEIPRNERLLDIPLYGHVEPGSSGRGLGSWTDAQVILGVPSDVPVAGYGGRTVNVLRLFHARSVDDFDMESFNRGDYMRAVEQRISSENISRVLYPSDAVAAGKELRLVQEYFLVSCAVRDIMRRYKAEHAGLSNFGDKVAIQMNDTHPALSVAEMMRILLDDQGMRWEEAWEITNATCAYTNHTLMPEALEKWSVGLMEHVLPRHLQIIYAINEQFIKGLKNYTWVDSEKLRRMSIIEEGFEKQVRMANLAIIGSHAVNGVSALHSDLVKTQLVPEFYKLWPEKFSNKTNGVAPRRWLLKANPGLSGLLTETIGPEWITDLEQLRKIEAFAEDAAFQQKFADIKRNNKVRLANTIKELTSTIVDPTSLFDVQIKRIHEYKRQLLAVLRVMHDYISIVEDGVEPVGPRTMIFAGKAAPGYWAAKQIIKLVHSVASVVNNDPRVKGLLKICFLPDYRVSLAETIIPGANISEQISTAGLEASGTSNMKFMMNGALTSATFDGANIEIYEQVGKDNIYIFGLRTEEIEKMQKEGSYQPRAIYESDPRVKRVLDSFLNDRFSPNEKGLFRWIFDELINHGDRFFLIADLPAYIEINRQIDADYKVRPTWRKKAILNTARSPLFSSDRTILEYANEIWKVKQYRPSVCDGPVYVADTSEPPKLADQLPSD